MTTVQDLFPSKYLKASDAEIDLVLTIAKVTKEKMQNRDGEEEIKPVISFTESQKSMVLNKTNGDTLAALFGDTIENWTGQKVILCAVDVDAFGKIQKALRFRAEAPVYDRKLLLARYQTLYEKAKTLQIEGLDDFIVNADSPEDAILEAGKQLKALVSAAEAFT